MVIIVLVMMLGVVKSTAQPSIPSGPGSGDPGYTPNNNGGGGDGGVPFDGGLSLILLAAGAGLGAKKKNAVIAVVK